ncbi:MAG: DUF4293 domain-containing protein [Bacteroidota bacterium]
MLQRAQTIFMAVVAICMGVVSSTTIWSKASANTNERVILNAITMDQIKTTGTESISSIFILIFAIIAGLIAIYSISQFKNRKLQMLLGAVNSMFIAIVMGVIFYYIFKKGMPAFDPDVEGRYELGFYAGGAALLANMIANRFIRRDENLVRSADRMR